MALFRIRGSNIPDSAPPNYDNPRKSFPGQNITVRSCEAARTLQRTNRPDLIGWSTQRGNKNELDIFGGRFELINYHPWLRRCRNAFGYTAYNAGPAVVIDFQARSFGDPMLSLSPAIFGETLLHQIIKYSFVWAGSQRFQLTGLDKVPFSTGLPGIEVNAEPSSSLGNTLRIMAQLALSLETDVLYVPSDLFIYGPELAAFIKASKAGRAPFTFLGSLLPRSERDRLKLCTYVPLAKGIIEGNVRRPGMDYMPDFPVALLGAFYAKREAFTNALRFNLDDNLPRRREALPQTVEFKTRGYTELELFIAFLAMNRAAAVHKADARDIWALNDAVDLARFSARAMLGFRGLVPESGLPPENLESFPLDRTLWTTDASRIYISAPDQTAAKGAQIDVKQGPQAVGPDQKVCSLQAALKPPDLKDRNTLARLVRETPVILAGNLSLLPASAFLRTMGFQNVHSVPINTSVASSGESEWAGTPEKMFLSADTVSLLQRLGLKYADPNLILTARQAIDIAEELNSLPARLQACIDKIDRSGSTDVQKGEAKREMNDLAVLEERRLNNRFQALKEYLVPVLELNSAITDIDLLARCGTLPSLAQAIDAAVNGPAQNGQTNPSTLKQAFEAAKKKIDANIKGREEERENPNILARDKSNMTIETKKRFGEELAARLGVKNISDEDKIKLCDLFNLTLLDDLERFPYLSSSSANPIVMIALDDSIKTSAANLNLAMSALLKWVLGKDKAPVLFAEFDETNQLKRLYIPGEKRELFIGPASEGGIDPSATPTEFIDFILSAVPSFWKP